MQATALEKLRSSLSPRPQRDTKYLERAVESPEFIHVDAEGFTFATDAFRNNPTINSYWRGIEFGSTKFVGREIHGFFRGPGGISAPSRDLYQTNERLIQVRGRNSGRFPAFRMIIERPIEAHEFLQGTLREYEAGLIDQIYRRHLGRWMA